MNGGLFGFRLKHQITSKLIQLTKQKNGTTFPMFQTIFHSTKPLKETKNSFIYTKQHLSGPNITKMVSKALLQQVHDRLPPISNCQSGCTIQTHMLNKKGTFFVHQIKTIYIKNGDIIQFGTKLKNIWTYAIDETKKVIFRPTAAFAITNKPDNQTTNTFVVGFSYKINNPSVKITEFTTNKKNWNSFDATKAEHKCLNVNQITERIFILHQHQITCGYNHIQKKWSCTNSQKYFCYDQEQGFSCSILQENLLYPDKYKKQQTDSNGIQGQI